MPGRNADIERQVLLTEAALRPPFAQHGAHGASRFLCVLRGVRHLLAPDIEQFALQSAKHDQSHPLPN